MFMMTAVVVVVVVVVLREVRVMMTSSERTLNQKF
jgi:hypothetical protein